MSKGNGEVEEIQDEHDWKCKVLNKTSNFPKANIHTTTPPIWCPPCRMIKSHVLELAQAHKRDGIVFLELNVDKSRSISKEFKVHSIPTFLCFCEGEVVEEVIGRDKNTLSNAVTKLLTLPLTGQLIKKEPHRLIPSPFKTMFRKMLPFS